MRYEFSYPLTYQKQLRGFEGHFRFVDEDGNEQLFRSLAGMAKFDGNDNSRGRLYIETELSVTGSHAQLYYPDEDIVIPKDAILLEGGDYWRCCFRHKNKDWRALSEANTELLYYTKECKGIIRMDWYDRSPHVYHVGPIYRLADDSILFVPSLSKGLVRPERVQQTIARSLIHDARTIELEEMSYAKP